MSVMQGRWIDKTFSAVVTVEEASASQIEALHRRLSPERFAQICTAEGIVEPRETTEIVSVEYDGLNPDRYEEGTFIAMVVRKENERVKVLFVHEKGNTEFAWLTPLNGSGGVR